MNNESLLRAPSSSLTRRTFTRGAAWTAPILAAGVAAPAFAASQVCERATVTWPRKGNPTRLTFSDTQVTAAVSFTSTRGNGSDSTPGDTGEMHWTDYQPSWRYIKMHHPEGMKKGDLITMTLTFSEPVGNAGLTITDIDRTTTEWIDEVMVSPLPSTAQKAANVIGSGTDADPFRSSVDYGIESAAGDLTLTWVGPVQTLTIKYRAADDKNDSGIGQHIGIGKIGFDAC